MDVKGVQQRVIPDGQPHFFLKSNQQNCILMNIWEPVFCLGQALINLQMKHRLLVAGLRITGNLRLRRKVKNQAYLWNDTILKNNDLVHMSQILHSMSHKNTRLKKK